MSRLIHGVLLAAAFSTSCADTAGSIVILHNQIADEGCAVSADDTGGYRADSFYDVSEPPDGEPNRGFYLTPLVQSNFVDDGDGTKVVIMERADVEIVASTAAPQASQALVDTLEAEDLHGYSPDTSGALDPGGL